MWYTERTAHLYAGIPAQDQQPAAQKTVVELWDFRQSTQLHAKFNGPGPKVMISNDHPPFDTWSFTTLEDKQIFVPRWKSLDVPFLNFLGFSKETPGSHEYLLTYGGRDVTDGSTGEVSMTVFKK